MSDIQPLPARRGAKRAPEHETAFARAAYEQYAAMGPTRSLRKMAKIWKDGKGSEQAKLYWLGIWSSRFAWQERVMLYDQDKADEGRRRRDDRRERANEKQYDLGERAMRHAMQEIERLVQQESFGPTAAAQLLKIGAELQRFTVEDEKDSDKDQGSGQIQIIIMNDDGSNVSARTIARPNSPVIDSTIA